MADDKPVVPEPEDKPFAEPPTPAAQDPEVEVTPVAPDEPEVVLAPDPEPVLAPEPVAETPFATPPTPAAQEPEPAYGAAQPQGAPHAAPAAGYTTQPPHAAPAAHQSVPPVNDGDLPDWLRKLTIYNGGQVPANPSGWSWAGFLFSWIYMFARSQWKVALAMLGVYVVGWILSSVFIGFLLFLVPPIIGGIYGRRLAFVGATPGKYPTDQSLKDADKPWVIGGVVLWIVSIVLIVIMSVMLAGMVAMMMGGGYYGM